MPKKKKKRDQSFSYGVYLTVSRFKSCTSSAAFLPPATHNSPASRNTVGKHTKGSCTNMNIKTGCEPTVFRSFKTTEINHAYKYYQLLAHTAILTQNTPHTTTSSTILLLMTETKQIPAERTAESYYRLHFSKEVNTDVKTGLFKNIYQITCNLLGRNVK